MASILHLAQHIPAVFTPTTLAVGRHLRLRFLRITFLHFFPAVRLIAFRLTAFSFGDKLALTL